jgi:hypothetical protein
MVVGLVALGQGESQRGFLLCHKSGANGIWVSRKGLRMQWGYGCEQAIYWKFQ